ncbi:uncharacterized protein B0J16DRAFT_41798 [Fusarium flagelliforme]|uniref:uncharacterized protein n=1 Tax=Fusarium flagelliforme TaxID=2675880 RepID=UPI001E8EC66E|nr:uncharacterized protein B0J16DRAFT_41798 [Fusarium flagelliforme]KAH7198594.1 hypothetical protein B0J16DRAFT_41798 [Fusarium flagelliforme]
MGWVRLQVACRCFALILLILFICRVPGPFPAAFPSCFCFYPIPLCRSWLTYTKECAVHIYKHTHTVTYTYTLGISPYSLYALNRFFFSWPPTFLLFLTTNESFIFTLVPPFPSPVRSIRILGMT